MKSYVFTNIPTINNSQPPIFPSDITAGQLDSDDNNSTTEYDEVSSNDDYSIESVSQKFYQAHGVQPVLTFCNESHLLNKSSSLDHWQNWPKSPYVKPTLA